MGIFSIFRRKKAELLCDKAVPNPILLYADTLIIGRKPDLTPNETDFKVRSKADRIDVYAGPNYNISRNHCKLVWNQEYEKYQIQDNSKFGSILDGHQMDRGKEYLLENKSKFSLAGVLHFQIIYSKK